MNEYDPWAEALSETMARIQTIGLPIRYGLCGTATDYLVKLLNGRGLSAFYVEGRCRGIDHAWVEDHKGRILDPTGRMFSPPLAPEEYMHFEDLTPGDVILYTPEEPMDHETRLDDCACGTPRARHCGRVWDTHHETDDRVLLDAYECSGCHISLGYFYVALPEPSRGSLRIWSEEQDEIPASYIPLSNHTMKC